MKERGRDTETETDKQRQGLRLKLHLHMYIQTDLSSEGISSELPVGLIRKLAY